MLLNTVVLLLCLTSIYGYSAYEDARIIRAFTKPQPPKDHAKVARTLVHKASWASTGTISTDPRIPGYSMVNIISIADSAVGEKSTGNIYFLLTMLDFTGQDIKKNNKITFMISSDEDLSCSRDNNTDPMEPTCARVILTGSVIELEHGTTEYEFASYSFTSRHPAAVNWNKAHTFFLCKLNIKNIYVLDWYGGPHIVTPDDYYKATPDEPKRYYENDIYEKPVSKREVHIKINKDKYKVIKIEL